MRNNRNNAGKLELISELSKNLTYGKVNLDDLGMGKLVMYINNGEINLATGNSVTDYVLSENNIPTTTSTLSDMDAKLTQINKLTDVVGYHAHINVSESSRMLGGGAYINLRDNKVFVGLCSGDYLHMDQELLKNLLAENNIELITNETAKFSDETMDDSLYRGIFTGMGRQLKINYGL